MIKSWIKRQPINFIVWGFIGLLFFPLIIRTGLNYSGMCLDELRYLSDKEKVYSAITVVNNFPIISFTEIENDHQPVQIDYKRYPQIKYDNVESFAKKNPNCCRFNPPEADHFDHPDFYARAFAGFNYDVILVSYTAKYISDNNKEYSHQIDRYVYLKNCGTAQLDEWH